MFSGFLDDFHRAAIISRRRSSFLLCLIRARLSFEYVFVIDVKNAAPIKHKAFSCVKTRE